MLLQGLFVDQSLFDSNARSEKGSLLGGSMYFGMCPQTKIGPHKRAFLFVEMNEPTAWLASGNRKG